LAFDVFERLMDEPSRTKSVRDWLAVNCRTSPPLGDQERKVRDWLDTGIAPSNTNILPVLIQLLAADTSFHPHLRMGLARALEAVGLSPLIICKKLRRRPGRPPKISIAEPRTLRYTPGMNDQERKAFDYLLDQNSLQRTTKVARSGKKTTIENDVSGGLAALIRLLEATEWPLHPALRTASAYALSSEGRLVVRKRLQSRRGRQERIVKKATAIHSAEVRVKTARRILESKRPWSPAGMEPNPITKTQAIAATKFGRTKTYEDLKELRKFRRKHPKPQRN
jgi:hypothetical protein